MNTSFKIETEELGYEGELNMNETFFFFNFFYLTLKKYKSR
jgi:hypothetical protein